MKCNCETFIFSLFFSQNLLGSWKPNKAKKKETFFTQKKKKPIFPIHHTSNIPFISLIFLSTFSETKQHALWPFIQHSNKNKLKKSICMKDLWWRNKQYQIAGLWTNSRKADVSRRSPKQSRWSLIELRILEKKSWDGLLLQ